MLRMGEEEMVEGAGLELHRLVWRVEGDERRKRVWGSGGGLGGRRFALGRGRGGVSLLFFFFCFLRYLLLLLLTLASITGLLRY